MVNLTEYLTQKYTRIITEISADLEKTADNLANTKNLLRALKNPDALVDGAPLTLDRLQVMESGDIRVVPPPPGPVVTGVGIASADETRGGPPELAKNGAKEPANAS